MSAEVPPESADGGRDPVQVYIEYWGYELRGCEGEVLESGQFETGAHHKISEDALKSGRFTNPSEHTVRVYAFPHHKKKYDACKFTLAPGGTYELLRRTWFAARGEVVDNDNVSRSKTSRKWTRPKKAFKRRKKTSRRKMAQRKKTFRKKKAKR